MKTVINWNAAPIDATHYKYDSHADVACWIKKGCNNKMHYITELYNKERNRGEGDNWIPTEDFGDSILTSRPKPVTDTFTKEFRVLGGVNEVWQKCKIVFKGNSYTVVENENGKEFSRKTAKIFIRDIDTRTDTEKCGSDLDKLGYLCNVSLINSIKAGKIHGVTFTGES